MKIKETIERECCQPNDMKIISGIFRECIHCRQVWKRSKKLDEAGEYCTIWIRIKE